MSQDNKKKPNDEVMFKVFAPRVPDQPILMCFSLSATVGEVADKAREEFGYEPAEYTLQDDKDKVLNRNDSLKMAHVKCGEHLDLVSTGGGVFKC